MRTRIVALLAMALTAGVIAVFLKLTVKPAAGQSAGLRTSWGAPDLQGIWARDGEVPLQRPAKYGNREFFTSEERAALDKERAAIIGREAAEERRDRGSETDVAGAYNANVFTTHIPMGTRTSLIVDPANGRIPPLTAEAQQRRAALNEYRLALLQPTDICRNKLPLCQGGTYGPPSPKRNEAPPYYLTGSGAGGGGGAINRSNGPEDRSLNERCIGGALPDFGGSTGFAPQIVQSRDAVSIFYDTGQGHAWQRVIPITDRPHLPADVRQWWGDSRGRWEGDSLVVDVTNFSPKSEYQGSRENLHLVERFTRVDADTLEYTATVEDPTTFTKPWTAKQLWKRQSSKANRHYKEPRCHEGNYGMAALLAGARAEERAFKEGRGPDPAAMCNGACGGFAAGFADDGEDANPINR